jgi:hypothetical protein
MEVYELVATIDQWANRFSYWGDYCGGDGMPENIFYDNLNTLFDFRLEVREEGNWADWIPVESTVKAKKDGNEIVFTFVFQVERTIDAREIKITNGTIEKEMPFTVHLRPNDTFEIHWKVGLRAD